MKRASVDIPATAIFTIIAGSLIILFFVTVSFNHSEQAKEETQAISLNYLETLIKTAATARETAKNISIVDETILFTCDEEGLRFGFDSGNELPLQDLVIFSPRRLEGGAVRVYSRGEDMPNRVFNVLYLSTPQFILQNSTVIPGLPRNIETTKLAVGSAGDPNRRAVMSITQVTAPQTWTNRPRDWVLLEPLGDGTYGRVHYRNPGNPATVVVYPTSSLLYGALISRDAQTYYCGFNAYLKQLKFVTRIQQERAQVLKDQAQRTGSSCYTAYQLSAYDAIMSLPAAQDFTVADARTFRDAVRELEFVNENLKAGDGCVSLY